MLEGIKMVARTAGMGVLGMCCSMIICYGIRHNHRRYKLCYAILFDLLLEFIVLFLAMAIVINLS